MWAILFFESIGCSNGSLLVYCINTLRMPVMKPGHHSRDDCAGYAVSNDAILGYFKKIVLKRNPFLQNNRCLTASIWNSWRTMENLFWPENARHWSPEFGGEFPKAGAPPAGEGARLLYGAAATQIGYRPQAWGGVNVCYSLLL